MLFAAASRLFVEVRRFFVEGSRLFVEGSRLFVEACFVTIHYILNIGGVLFTVTMNKNKVIIDILKV